MAIPEFNTKPSRAELAQFATRTTEGREKLAELAAWMKELRQIQRDPELAKKYAPPKEVLDRFYSELEKDYQAIPLSKEEIERNFTAENLSTMSLENYVELLRRVPPRFVTHVTRQGIRDHISHHYGDQDQFNDGFGKILESGKIQSILETYLQGVISKETVQALTQGYLRIPEDFSTLEEARKRIDEFLNRSIAPPFASAEIADKRALHVAMDFVADDYYGGERGNEIFFIYPTAFVAAQNYLAPQAVAFQKGLRSDDISQRNDYWIQSKKDGKGELVLDAAIVFIPENAQVDPETGSRYAVENGKPVANTEQINNLKSLIASPELRALWPGLHQEADRCRSLAGDILRQENRLAELESDGKDHYQIAEVKKMVTQLRAAQREQLKKIQPLFDLAQSYGVTDKRFAALFESSSLSAWQSLIDLLGRTMHEAPFKTDPVDQMRVQERFRDVGLQYALAARTEPAKEYWEKYFVKVGKRPSKVIYYEQGGPNNALRAFKEKAGLSKNDTAHPTDLRELFRENLISNREMYDQMEQERAAFLRFSNEVLDELYRNR